MPTPTVVSPTNTGLTFNASEALVVNPILASSILVTKRFSGKIEVDPTLPPKSVKAILIFWLVPVVLYFTASPELKKWFGIEIWFVDVLTPTVELPSNNLENILSPLCVKLKSVLIELFVPK